MTRLIVIAVATASLIAGPHASALIPLVSMTSSDTFDPKDHTIIATQETGWHNSDTEDHSVTVNDSVPGSFDHVVHPSISLTTDFFDAVGTYPYHCTFHKKMVGTIGTEIYVDSGTKPKGQPFALTWASDPGGGILNYDIQVKGPGDDRFHTLFKDQSAESGEFAPTKRGVYKLRGRTQSATGESTGWSPTRKIELT